MALCNMLFDSVLCGVLNLAWWICFCIATIVIFVATLYI